MERRVQALCVSPALVRESEGLSGGAAPEALVLRPHRRPGHRRHQRVVSPPRAKTPKSARPPSSRQKTPQGSPEAAAPPSPEDDAPPSPEAQAPPSPEAEFAVGQRIEANFEGEGEWFAGVVDKVEDGRYDITYDDGDEEFGVEAARVRAATGDADVLAPLPAPQDELRRSDEYEESFEEEN